MKPIRTAVVGFGLSGQTFHAPIIDTINETELYAFVSSNEKAVKAAYPNAKVYAQFDEMLNDESIELVVITTPNDLHYPMAKAAVCAGKNVVIEKPFVIDTAQGEHLIDLAKQHNVTVSVYHNRRYDGDFLTIKQLIDQGKLGKVHTFESSYNRYRPEVKVRWKESSEPGSGIWYDLGSHLVDQALQLFGKPTSVFASLRAQRDNAQSVDQFLVILNYDERDVVLRGDCLSTDAGARYIVKGDKGHYIKFGIDPQETDLQQGKRPNQEGWGLEPQQNYGTLTDSESAPHTITTLAGNYPRYYQELASHLRDGTPVPVSAEQALQVIEVIQAAEDSAETQRAVFM